LGLRTILWDYDTNDWQVGETTGVTPESVDAMYQVLIDDAGKGLFDTVSTVLFVQQTSKVKNSRLARWSSHMSLTISR